MSTPHIKTRIINIQKGLKVPQTGIFDMVTCKAIQTLSDTLENSNILSDNIKAVQRIVGLRGNDVDGIIGVISLTKIEDYLRLSLPEIPEGASLIVSKYSLDFILKQEVSSKALYNQKYNRPIWPGASSGVTIGIGYDLGYNNASEIRTDWTGLISENDILKLISVCLISGQAAKALVADVADVIIPFESAVQVFYQTSMPKYAKRVRQIYPGVELLPPDAQGALLSLVYNRGHNLNGARRIEMKNIVAHVAAKNLNAIANEIIAMKRLWGNNLRGLLIRRDKEAEMVRNATYYVNPNDIRIV